VIGLTTSICLIDNFISALSYYFLLEIAMDTLEELLEDELKDIYSAENQLIKALPKMAKKASSPVLKHAITSHLEETKNQVVRLEKVAKILEIKLTGKKCAAMEGLVEEGKEVIEEDGQGPVIDAALIGAAQRVEHYEMAAYGTVKAIAKQLGQSEVVALLQETLDEEGAADKKLTTISTKEILPAAPKEGDDEGNDESDEE
jgi:ferritin-like metal-binding protein YciE